ncbi:MULTISPECIES: hypothetical protein [Streptosporangium]|jgi:hypothetical protein|uniref:Uncharacterized protein n=1 Tax=Streptosporangium longisporum TaxID=46187 RepID=A0ABP6LGU5_9ACTN
MTQEAVPGSGSVLSGRGDSMRVDPPRKGLRPGTAAGDPQTPF